jgi:hypothetical protein
MAKTIKPIPRINPWISNNTSRGAPEMVSRSYAFACISILPRQTVNSNKIKRPPEGGLFSVPDQLTNAAGSGQIS